MKERCNLHHSEPGEDGLNFQGALHVFRPVFKRPTEPDHREDTEEETEWKKKFAKKFGDSLQFIIPYTPAFFHTQMGGFLWKSRKDTGEFFADMAYKNNLEHHIFQLFLSF